MKFDRDTGELTPEQQLAQAIRTAEVLRSESSALVAMKATAGWRIVTDFIDSAITSSTEQLVICTDYKEVRRLQEYIKALSNVSAFVDGKILEGERAFESLGIVEGQSEGIDPDEEMSSEG